MNLQIKKKLVFLLFYGVVTHGARQPSNDLRNDLRNENNTYNPYLDISEDSIEDQNRAVAILCKDMELARIGQNKTHSPYHYAETHFGKPFEEIRPLFPLKPEPATLEQIIAGQEDVADVLYRDRERAQFRLEYAFEDLDRRYIQHIAHMNREKAYRDSSLLYNNYSMPQLNPRILLIFSIRCYASGKGIVWSRLLGGDRWFCYELPK